MWVLDEQRGRRHDLTRLAISTGRNIGLDPSSLERMRPILGKPFDGDDLLCANLAHRRLTTLLLFVIDKNRACAAGSYAATIFRTRQFEHVSQNPKEGHIGRCFHLMDRTIDI